MVTIKKIAALLTCYNRKDLTIVCLNSLISSYYYYKDLFELDIYLTDDGSTDGTSEAVARLYPKVKILHGTGYLFWAGGMLNSWRAAVEGDYDTYLLLNDDTKVLNILFSEMIKTHQFCQSNYNCDGIYIGSTINPETRKTTYGGYVIKSKILNTTKRIDPNSCIQNCDLGNGNIMFVCRGVVNKIGILSPDYIHGVADFDYTLTAKRNHIPVLTIANYCGECYHEHPDTYSIFSKFSISERIKYLYNPVGLGFSDQQKFMKKFYPLRLPLFIIAGWFKVFFPQIYILLNKFRFNT